MCILCVVQKWSRRVATMLPWLVIPLIGLWALSQLLPPSLRFEITSPRLACVGVLLITLFWYEVLMPQLSMWRARRSAHLRERQRLEAMELQKLRKSATRRCRNCHTPYRDQNPGGGRFMCSYCGHISKRPVLDIPGSPVSGIANSGFGKIWNGKVWLENGWGCGQDWSENANWTPSLGGKSVGKNGTGYFSGDDRCSAEKSYSGIIFYICKLLSYFFLSIWWLWRKIIRVSSAQDGGSSDVENKGLMSKKGENGGNFHESRGEKARRKAEEKRQARLERELREEEERKQREEVARLVEERRKLRDEKSEVDKECGKGLTIERERDNKRDAEKRRQERRKDRDRGSRLSSKSNSDGEELEKKGNRESERKREFDKRTDIERWDAQRTSAESVRAAGSDTGNAMKGTMNSFGRVSGSGSGSKYFDRMKGSLLSSSKAFNGTGFFGRGAQSAASAGMKMNKPTGFGEHVPASANRKELHSADHLVGRLTASGDNKITQSPSHQPVGSDLQPCSTVQKKSWQQLFTRSSATSTSLDANNTIYQQSLHHQLEFQNSLQPDRSLSGYFFDKQIHFGIPLPQSVGPMSGGSVSSSVSPVNEAVFPLVGGLAHDFMSEEGELFEDSCYAPDPVSLIGPVSESLDDLPLDLGSGFITNTGLDRSDVLKNMAASVDVSRPAPIESPFSRSRVAEERHLSSGQRQCTLKSADLHASPLDGSNNAAEQGTWHMWGTPLGHEGLGLVGGTSWLLPLGQNKPEQEEILNPLLQEAKISQHSTEKQVLQGTHTPLEVCVGGCQNGEDFNPLGHGSSNNDIWWGKTVFEAFSGDGGNPFPPLNMQKDLSLSEVNCDSPSKLAATHQFKPSPANYLPKTDWGEAEGEGNDGSATEAMPRIGGLFTTPNVQSLWSFN